MPVKTLDTRSVEQCYAPVCWLSGYSAANKIYTALYSYLESALEHVSPEVRQGNLAVSWLEYPFGRPDYEAFSKEIALIGPVDEQMDPIAVQDLPEDLYQRDPVQLPNIVSLRTVSTHLIQHNDDDPGLLMYSTSENEYVIDENSTMTTVNDLALQVVQLAAPSLTVARLWLVWWLPCQKSPTRKEQVLDGIDYGPIADFARSDSILHWWGEDPVLDAWILDFIRRGDAPTAADRRTLMFGRGRLYVDVAPRMFPISEAFQLSRESCLARIASSRTVEAEYPSARLTLANVPVDILRLIADQLELRSLLSFIASCRQILQALFPVANTIARRRMQQYERWYYPRYNDDYSWGDVRNVEWLEQLCAAGGVDTFPWLFYALACVQSPSMENTKRIWFVGEQIEALADQWDVPRV